MKVNSIFKIYLIFLVFNLSLCGYHSKEEWKSRSVYQILTDRFATDDRSITNCTDLGNSYCGGNYKGIIEQLDYISDMGFDAIWISPPFKNKENRYHGYHNIDLYTVNEHFGTADDLKNLVKECHKRDIWVILDAVPNHMADDADVSSYKPFNLPEYYHNLNDPECSQPNQDQYHKENCDQWDLKDLKQENDFVKNELIKWLEFSIKEYDFDGVRYADVANVPKWFWGNFTEAAKTYTLGIVSSNDEEYIYDYQNYMDGVGEYTLYHVMKDAFCTGSMKDLDKYIRNNHTKYLFPQYNGIWFSNHDNERFLYKCTASNNKDKLLNGIIFTLFFEGIPIFYYGDEQYCELGGDGDRRREILFWRYDNTTKIYNYLKIAHNVRKEQKIYEADFMRRYADDNFYVFTRGNVLIAVGVGNTGSIKLSRHGYKSGDKLCNRFQDNDCISVDDNYELNIEMGAEPKIYVKIESSYHTENNGAKFLSLFSLLFILLLW